MKRLLPILFVLFVALLNIRALFCADQYKTLLYPKFSAYDAIASSRKSSFYPDEKIRISLLVKERCGLPYCVGSIFDELKNSDVCTELGIQQLRNVLKTEINLVTCLQAGKKQSLRKKFFERNELVDCTAPTICYFYNRIMNIVTRHGRLVSMESVMTQKEQRSYLKKIKCYLTGVDTELYMMQKSI